MTAYRNLKIGIKLMLGFGVLLVLAALVVILSLRNLRFVNEDLIRLQEYPAHRYNILNIMSENLANARRITSVMSFRLGDHTVLATLRSEAMSGQASIGSALDEFQSNLREDTVISPSVRDGMLRDSDTLRGMFNRYTNEIINGMYTAARDGIVGDPVSRDRVEVYLNSCGVLYGQIAEIFYALRQSTEVMMNERTAELVQRSDFVRTAATIASVSSIIFAMIFAVFTSGSITKPLSRAVSAMKDVSIGNLNINLDRSNIPKDETGELTRDIIIMSDMIRAVLDDMAVAYDMYMVKGNSKYRIDTSKYQNAYKDLVETTNSTYEEVTLVTLGAIDAFQQISIGNFDVKVHEEGMVGDWAAQPQAINAVIKNLKNVSAEVNAMIDAVAAKGDLGFQIDADKYKGDWQKIMEGLNNITQAVDVPLKVMAVTFGEMKNGNFNMNELDKKLVSLGFESDVQKYKGVFRECISALEVTMTDISSYIDELDDVLAKMSGGDLRNRISRTYVGSFDLIKRSVNNISDTLNKTMSEILSAADQVLSGAGQISQSAFDLSSGAQEQASSVQELNATIDIISQQTTQNADNAAIADKLSNKSNVNAKDGNESMKHMVEAMTKIKESSGDISKIVKTIQDIAFQTNLLALNASVEAARAGEHGKGFSVVADEVRSLAGRSQEAATETTELINDSISRVDSGSSIAGATSESLGAIVSSAEEVLGVISKISKSSREQAESISNVSDGLAQISQVVQNNSAVSEETAAASQELNSQAEVLRQLVSFFKL